MSENQPVGHESSAVQTHLEIMQSCDTANGGKQPVLQGLVRDACCRHPSLGSANGRAAPRADSPGADSASSSSSTRITLALEAGVSGSSYSRSLWTSYTRGELRYVRYLQGSAYWHGFDLGRALPGFRLNLALLRSSNRYHIAGIGGSLFHPRCVVTPMVGCEGEQIVLDTRYSSGFHDEGYCVQAELFVRTMGKRIVDRSVDTENIDDTGLKTRTIRQKIRDSIHQRCVCDNCADWSLHLAKKACGLGDRRQSSEDHEELQMRSSRHPAPQPSGLWSSRV